MASVQRTIARNIVKAEVDSNFIAATWHRLQNTKYSKMSPSGINFLNTLRRMCSSFALHTPKSVKKARRKATQLSRKINWGK